MTQDVNDNTVVILSDDDDEEELVNMNDYDSMEEYEAYMQNTNRFASRICKSQNLPDDHEPVIHSEREQINMWKELDEMISKLKQVCIPDSMTLDDTETSFACGVPVKDNAPDVAINIEGIPGPITFPLCPKDTKRILNTVSEKSGYLDISKVVLNLSFKEYLEETLLPEMMAYLGVGKHVAEDTRLQANRLHICEEGQVLNLPTPEGAYGSALLILPTDFTGGHVQAVYKDQNAMFQPESDTLQECYYVAWYNDVKTNFFPVTSGYQVSISFSLVYTGTDPTVTTASLQQQREMVENCQFTLEQQAESQHIIESAAQILQSVTSQQEEVLVYFLKFSYTLPRTVAKELKQSDKMIMALLNQVVAQTEFSVHLGEVERKVEAQVDEGDKEDCPIDEEGIHLTQCVIKDTYTLTSLCDEGGNNLLQNPVVIESLQPIIQGVNWYAKCKPDAEEYVEKENLVKYWYAKKTALVFIPKFKLDSFLIKN
ncbi:hypothetical protein INT48_006640 [Thamnidium elegans]|uniref:Uncharacterized protein n=1 Tax=Thamnidium elegans TaxID=101142 RepID=A0A8H7SY83_9FUNG|nr:hypothetical protein INT48_006640 [Thamnidium elegans]